MVWLWIKLFGRHVDWHVALAAILTAFVTAAACAEILTAVVRKSIAIRTGSDERQRRARATTRVLRVLLLILLTIVFIPPVLDLFGEPLATGLRMSVLVDWVFGSGLKILFIATFAYLLTRIIELGTHRFERRLADQHGAGTDEYGKRARTIGDLIRNVSTAAILAIAGVYVLKELRFDPLPLLTGAGIAGLAIGFGAQTLVKDVISGFFLILENQIRVGDVAEINGIGGLVEAIHLRTIVLRDQRGAVYVVPCGTITSLANLTKDFAYAVLDLRVHYRHDLDHVIEIIRKTAAQLRTDSVFSAYALADLEVLGVENLGDLGVVIRVRMRTLPQRQWEVGRELRLRIKRAFDDLGIEIPMMPIAGEGAGTVRRASTSV